MFFKKHSQNLVIILLSLLSNPVSSAFAKEEIVLIASKNSWLSHLSPEQIKSLYLGEISFIDRKKVEISDRSPGSEIRELFFDRWTGMGITKVTRHWARMVFTGKASPMHRITGDDSKAKEWVTEGIGRVAYIYRKNADDTVRVVSAGL